MGLKIRRADPLPTGRTDSDKSFPLPPKITIANSHIVRYTCQFEQYLSHRQNEAPTKEPTVSCSRCTPTPKQDRFQDLLEAFCPDFLHTTLTKYNNYHCYSNIPQLLSAEVVLCTHKTTILCQFGLFCHQLTTISPSILKHFWWELYQLKLNFLLNLRDNWMTSTYQQQMFLWVP